jgi:UDP-3-O-[3-hydroxymyristoyl] glucosamine N-acyltransferase
MAVEADTEVREGIAVGNGVAVGIRTAVGNKVEVGVGVLVGTDVATGVEVGMDGTVGSSLGGVLVIDESTSLTTGEGRNCSCPAHAIRNIPAAKITQPPLRVKRTSPPLR